MYNSKQILINEKPLRPEGVYIPANNAMLII